MVIAGIPCTMPAIWIGLIVIFLIVEGLTAGLVTIWFAVGALAALIAAMFLSLIHISEPTRRS